MISDRCPGIMDPRKRETKYSAVSRIPKESQSTAIPPERSASDHNNRRPSSTSPALSIWTPFRMPDCKGQQLSARIASMKYALLRGPARRQLIVERLDRCIRRRAAPKHRRRAVVWSAWTRPGKSAHLPHQTLNGRFPLGSIRLGESRVWCRRRTIAIIINPGAARCSAPTRRP